MASPQKENGYMSLANSILDALCRFRIPGEARQVIDTVFRKTYGFNKKQDHISLSQFCLSTGMRRPDICRALNKAISMNIIKVISKKANEIGNTYCINKDFDTWKPLAKKRRGVAKKLIKISKKANNHSLISDIQKTVSKDTLTKDILSVSFQSFWNSYPRKQAKKTAETSWAKISIFEHDAIFKALPIHCDLESWKRDRGKYIPLPATWLNQERWKDEITPTQGILVSTLKCLNCKKPIGSSWVKIEGGYLCGECNSGAAPPNLSKLSQLKADHPITTGTTSK